MNVWTCNACGFPVADSTGVIAAPITDIADPPIYGIEWKPWHDKCAPYVDAYSIPVEQLRDHEAVLKWTAHLLGKVWLANSNWSTVIRSTLGVPTSCG